MRGATLLFKVGLETIAIDLLHTWHLGGIAEYVGASLWFIIHAGVLVQALCEF
jgi:hypothetical protein